MLPPLTISAVEPTIVLPGTRLVIHGTGIVDDDDVTTYRVRAGAVEVAGTVTREDGDNVVVATLPDGLPSTFAGALVVERVSEVRERASKEVVLTAFTSLEPRLDQVEADELYLGDRVVMRGAGMLLAGEGFTVARIAGTFTDVYGDHPIDDLVVPLEPVDRDRLKVALTLTPDVLGIRPGTLSATLTLENEHDDGHVTRSEPLALVLPLRAPVLAAVSPTAAARGQRVTLTGRGLLATDELLQTATVLVLDGVFTPRRGLPQSFEGTGALAIYPDAIVGNTQASAILRVVLDDEGVPSGLGARAGRFVGRATAVVLAGTDAVEGPPLPIDFSIRNPKQVVLIRFLPGFADALVRFGLLAEREAIEARILEVLERDYDGINIEFRLKPVTDFAEYSVVEVGGKDPNGTGLFGLDNTAGKDVGNQRFDDVIGGFNAETRAGNFAAYGGIFAEELVNLSPQIGANELASPRFDDIFEMVMPELGGQPAKAGESARFDARGAAIQKAVRVLGNLVGTTITHEVGHSLGLTAINGRYHNEGDTPNAIMDAGQFRPFEERAEIDGQGPGVFEPFNRTYLESILPLDPETP